MLTLELSPPTSFASLSRRARARLLRMHFESGVGHVGGNLSAIDLLLGLHHHVLKPEDRFVLSKGHAAGALYVTLWSQSKLTEEDLLEFHREDTRLAGHPPTAGVPGVLFATGSLGHGLGLAAGLALAMKLKREAGRVFCLMSDGEWNEGSCWEALIFAVQRGLDNLTFVVDVNGLQGFGTTYEVADLDSLPGKFAAFGAAVCEIDGHDAGEISAVLRDRGAARGRPRAVVARTVKGRGVPGMENRLESHYLPLTADQYRLALARLEEEERLEHNERLEKEARSDARRRAECERPPVELFIAAGVVRASRAVTTGAAVGKLSTEETVRGDAVREETVSEETVTDGAITEATLTEAASAEAMLTEADRSCVTSSAGR